MPARSARFGQSRKCLRVASSRSVSRSFQPGLEGKQGRRVQARCSLMRVSSGVASPASRASVACVRFAKQGVRRVARSFVCLSGSGRVSACRVVSVRLAASPFGLIDPSASSGVCCSVSAVLRAKCGSSLLRTVCDRSSKLVQACAAGESSRGVCSCADSASSSKGRACSALACRLLARVPA